MKKFIGFNLKTNKFGVYSTLCTLLGERAELNNAKIFRKGAINMSSLNQVAQVVAEYFQLETKGVAAERILDREIIACPRNATDISLSKPDNRDSSDYSRFTDDELVRAVELMISPDDLTIREVAEALLKTLDFRPQDVLYQLKEGVPLNAGPVLCLSI